MAFITIIEILDIFVMAGLIGFLFMDLLPSRNESRKEKFKLSVIALAPAIILHELAHKFVAMSFGLEAVFKAFYHNLFTLGLGAFAIFAKLSNFGMIFLVPGYVEICSGNNACGVALAANPLWGAIIAFAGPAIHLILWGISSYLLKYKSKNLSEKQFTILILNKKINLFLFIFNMIPFPPFDGGSVFYNLSRVF